MGQLIKYFEKKAKFNNTKVSNKSDNSESIINGSVVYTEPDVKWGAIAFIEDTGEIWTHGNYFSNFKEDIDEIKNTLNEVEELLNKL